MDKNNNNKDDDGVEKSIGSILLWLFIICWILVSILLKFELDIWPFD